MKNQVEQILLRSFFGAYFHEDWYCDDATTEEVVTRYMQSATPSELQSLGNAIRNYSLEFGSDEQLREKLFTDLGCYYCPGDDGLSAKAWLENVAIQVLRGNRS